jgi:adrenodoxin-NADP+ reductase
MPPLLRSTTTKLLTRPSLLLLTPRHPFSTTATNAINGPNIAIVGAGPAGFWTAQSILKRNQHATVDILERLPVPFGLVRYGVAPDHPEVRNCEDIFNRVMESGRVNFRGNVDVQLHETTTGEGRIKGGAGTVVGLADLARAYDAVVLATGANVEKRLGVPGEDIPGVYSAREFVGWYTGLPSCADLAPKIPDSGEVVVIGVGNVAMDVARILLSPLERLAKTDMPEYALEHLNRHRVKRVSIVGRRGLLQAKFTIKELRELITLPESNFWFDSPHYFPQDLKVLPRPQKRIAELLLKSTSQLDTARSVSNLQPTLPTPLKDGYTQKEIALLSMLSPLSFHASPEFDLTDKLLGAPASSLEKVLFARTMFASLEDAYSPDANCVPVSNAEEQMVELPAQMALTAIGYDTEPLPIVMPDNVYRVGWARMGGRGVLAGTQMDAGVMGEKIVLDLNATDGAGRKEGWAAFNSELKNRNVRVTEWRDWQAIDHVERKKGQNIGKVREKITNVDGMLRVLDG